MKEYNLTDEQQAIVDYNGKENLIVSAVAGGAKTTTLRLFAKLRPNKKFLYIVFNKAMKLESEEAYKGINNVKVLTTFGLAYSETGRFYRDKLTGSYKAFDLAKDLGLGFRSQNDKNYSYMVLNVWNAYIKSAIDSIEEFTEEYNLGESQLKKVNELLTKLFKLKKDRKNNVMIQHAFYLKLYTMKNPNLGDYDYITLDECLTGDHYIRTSIGSVRIDELYKKYVIDEELPLINSYNLETKEFEFKRMTWAMKSELREVIVVNKGSDSEIRCTCNHKILTNRGYVMAGNLIPYQDKMISNKFLYSTTEFSEVESVETYGFEDVYDIEVEDNHNFITSLTKGSLGTITHNCQDSSEPVIRLLNSQPKAQIISIGDQSQSIYGFMGAVNALNKFEGKRMFMSHSFRVGQETADVVNKIYGFFDKSFNMVGANPKQKIVKSLDIREPHVVICRTRAMLFKNAIEAMDKDYKIHFVGGLKGYNFASFKNAYFFSRGSKSKYDNTFNGYKDWAEVKADVEGDDDNLDPEIKFLYKIVNQYGVKIAEYIDKMDEYAVSRMDQADVTLTTCHKSKGAGYDRIILEDDFIDFQDLAANMLQCESEQDRMELIESHREEINIAYVAITRSQGVIKLNERTTEFIDKLDRGNNQFINKEFKKLQMNMARELRKDMPY